MSNIVGINDLNNGNRGEDPFQDAFQSMSDIFPFSVPILEQKSPREETFYYMLKNTFCRSFKLNSFIGITVLLNLFVFVLMIFLFGVQVPGQFLQLNKESLRQFGALDPQIFLKELSILRPLTSLFLASSFLDFSSRNLFFIMIGSSIEYAWELGSTLKIYLISGILANWTFAILYTNQQFVFGNQPCLFSFLACYLTYFIVNWNYLARYDSKIIYCSIFFVIFFTIYLFTFTTPSNSTPLQALGYFYGIPISILFSKPKINFREDENILKISKLIIAIATSLLVFQTFIKYQDLNQNINMQK